MEIKIEDMENQGIDLLYESPSLKKYGTMKDLTNSFGGSGSDATGKMPDGGSTGDGGGGVDDLSSNPNVNDINPGRDDG